jgi:hypothetical protein
MSNRISQHQDDDVYEHLSSNNVPIERVRDALLFFMKPEDLEYYANCSDYFASLSYLEHKERDYFVRLCEFVKKYCA